jgi:P-type Cu+ transporter
LRLAAVVEAAPEHPIARAIAAGACGRVGELPAVADFANTEGLGVRSVVDGHAVIVGWERLLAEWSLSLAAEIAAARHDAEESSRDFGASSQCAPRWLVAGGLTR